MDRMISIIIPVYNEGGALRKNSRFYEKIKDDTEILFVDGGSSDETIRVASEFGRVLRTEKGRALQMNYGARKATGEVLLFLHADCWLSDGALSSACNCIKDGVAGGCFTQRLENSSLAYRIIEGIGNRRARKQKLFYGDQGIFVRRDIFFLLGGFPEVPVMEDILFSERLRKTGRVEVLDNVIYASTRCWEKQGFCKTNLSYTTMVLLFYLRLPFSLIKKLYIDVR